MKSIVRKCDYLNDCENMDVLGCSKEQSAMTDYTFYHCIVTLSYGIILSGRLHIRSQDVQNKHLT